MKKALIGIGIVALIILAVIAYTKGVEKAGEKISETVLNDGATTTVPVAELAFTPANTTFDWKCATQNDEKTQFVPRSVVSLEATSKGRVSNHPVGEYTGFCSAVSKMEANQLSGNLNYFAGGGTEFGVFNENGRIIVKSRELEEGTAEIPGFTTEYKTLFIIEPQKI